MKLTSEHKEAVATWVAAGATLNEIQDRLKNELGVTLTFMDTRFLLSDLGLTLKPEAGEEDDAEVLDVGGAETGVGGGMDDAGVLARVTRTGCRVSLRCGSRWTW